MAIVSPVRELPPLRAVRRARQLGLAEVARRAGVDKAHLSRAERGEAHLSLDALERVARVLGLRELAETLEPYTRGANDVSEDGSPATRKPGFATSADEGGGDVEAA